MTGLTSCVWETSAGLMRTTWFDDTRVEQSTPAEFYKANDLYYVACNIRYECSTKAFAIAETMVKRYELPIVPEREPVIKKYYFQLEEDVARRVLGVSPAPPG